MSNIMQFNQDMNTSYENEDIDLPYLSQDVNPMYLGTILATGDSVMIANKDEGDSVIDSLNLLYVMAGKKEGTFEGVVFPALLYRENGSDIFRPIPCENPNNDPDSVICSFADLID